MSAPRELSQQIATPGQKLGCKSPRVGANFWCKPQGVRGGGWLWMKLIPALQTSDIFLVTKLSTLSVPLSLPSHLLNTLRYIYLSVFVSNNSFVRASRQQSIVHPHDLKLAIHETRMGLRCLKSLRKF